MVKMVKMVNMKSRGPKGLQLEVRARRAPRLLVINIHLLNNKNTIHITKICNNTQIDIIEQQFTMIYPYFTKVPLQYIHISQRFHFNIFIYHTGFPSIYSYITQVSLQYIHISHRFHFNIFIFHTGFTGTTPSGQLDYEP